MFVALVDGVRDVALPCTGALLLRIEVLVVRGNDDGKTEEDTSIVGVMRVGIEVGRRSSVVSAGSSKGNDVGAATITEKLLLSN